jgi:sigma-B regulation protein RsbU (phosphoserine phosphatase)
VDPNVNAVKQKSQARVDERLTDLVSLESLQQIQDRFAELGKVTVCIATVEGEPITTPTWGSHFSKLIGTSPLGRQTFAAALQERASCTTNDKVIECHHGMRLYAATINYERQQLGTLIVGTRTGRVPTEEAVALTAAEFNIDAKALQEVVGQIDPYLGGVPEAIHRFADVLAGTIANLYGQAHRIRRQLADLQAVHSLTNLLTGSRDLQEILDATVKRVAEVMRVKACAIRLLNEETGELVIKAVYNLSEEYLKKGPVMLDDATIDATAFAGEAVHLLDIPGHPRTRYPENARREGIVSGLCVPLTYRGQTIGVIRVYTSKRYEFRESEEALLRSIGSQAAAAIITNRLWCEQAEADRVQHQVTAAGEIQRRMLPIGVPNPVGLGLGCIYDPSLQLGGDFYDLIELPDGSFGVCVADVVGKGLPAALLMASIRSALRVHAFNGLEVNQVVANLNGHLCRDTLAGEFATLFYGTFSPDGRRFVYCNAGHTTPLILRGDEFTELTAGGLVIGVLADELYEQAEILLKSGDVLVIVTDGVTEAMDFDGRIYGDTRLRESIRKHRELNAQQLAGQLHWDVRRYAGLAPQSDDITIMVVKVC